MAKAKFHVEQEVILTEEARQLQVSPADLEVLRWVAQEAGGALSDGTIGVVTQTTPSGKVGVRWGKEEFFLPGHLLIIVHKPPAPRRTRPEEELLQWQWTVGREPNDRY